MINFGMIWYEPNPKNTMLQTIIDALEFYNKKYPNKPSNLILVHPFEFNSEIEYSRLLKDLGYGVINVKPWQYVLPRNPIIGVADDSIL